MRTVPVLSVSMEAILFLQLSPLEAVVVAEAIRHWRRSTVDPEAEAVVLGPRRRAREMVERKIEIRALQIKRLAEASTDLVLREESVPVPASRPI